MNFQTRLRSVMGIHANRRGGVESDRPIRHDFWVLDYLVEGSVLVRTSTSGGWRKRVKGEAHLYPPRTEYWERHADEESSKSCHIIFECPHDAELRRLTDESPYGYALIADDASILLKLFRKYDSAFLLTEQRRSALENSIFWEALYHLLSLPSAVDGRHSLTMESNTNISSPLVRRVLKRLNERFAEKTTLSDLCREFAVSRTALYNEFVKFAGETPTAALTRIRLKHADDFILRGTRLKEAAALTGFSSAYHLSKAYKNFYGIPPSKAR